MWYRADHSCAFHQGAPGHDVENCYGLKYEVQKLVRSGALTFKDVKANVTTNPLPSHGGPSVNMITEEEGDKFQYIWQTNKYLPDLHQSLLKLGYYSASKISSAHPRAVLRGCSARGLL